MPSNPIVICARSKDLRGRIEATLSAAGYATVSVPTHADAMAAVRRMPADLIVAEGLAASGAVTSLRTAIDGRVTPILLVAPGQDVETRIAFLEAGADEVIASTFSEEELEERVLALLIRFRKVQPESPSGMTNAAIVTFFSGKGGVGTTTLAVNTALLLAGGGDRGATGPSSNGSLPPTRVLLIDLVLQFGQVATHLNLTPRYDLAGLALDEAALADPELARSYLSTHHSGISVLAAPSRPEADFQVGVEHVQRIIEVVQPSFDFIVVDLGSRLDPRTLWLLEEADAHVIVLFPELAALRATSMLMAFLNETATLRAKTYYVVNHILPKEPLKMRDVENLLRSKLAAEIPFVDIEMIRAVNEGAPLALSRPASPAIVAMRRIAQAVIGVEQSRPAAAPTARRGLFGRRAPS